MLAYLVIREGSKWTDVFRLVPGQSVTIGRAPTNQIVVKDERCSRNHAEVFQSEGQWTLRDLDSRNGTLVGDGQVRGDHSLPPGDIIRIGNSHLAFVHDLSQAFPDSARSRARTARRRQSTTVRTGRDADVERARRPRADDDHASPRPDEVPRAARRGRRRRLEGRPRRRQAVPAGVRAGQEPRRRVAWPTWRSPACSKARKSTPARCCCCGAAAGDPTADGLEVIASRSDTEPPVPSRLAVPGHDRAARGPGRAGPQRDGRQHARQPRQQGRDSRHERDLRPDPPRPQGARPDPSVFDRTRPRARSRRSGIHAGRGRHGGRGARRTCTAGRSWPRI